MIRMNETRIQDKKLDLIITTPRGVKFKEKADMVVMRCIDGDLGVLYGHAPVSAPLGDGILRVYNDGTEKKYAVFGGIAEIENNIVKIFSTIAQRRKKSIWKERKETEKKRKRRSWKKRKK